MSNRRKGPDAERSRLLRSEKPLAPASATGGDLKVHLLSPEPYELAMSGLSFQSIFTAFGSVPGVAIERAFLPKERENWRCLERGTPIGECDLLSVGVSFELCYLDALRGLRQARALFSSAEERAEKLPEWGPGQPLLLAGGIAPTANPEPLAEFFDMVFLGEAEEFIPQLVELLRSARQRSLGRRAVLAEAATLEGCYVPALYEPRYSPSGGLEEILFRDSGESVVRPGASPRPARRIVSELSTFPACSAVVSPETEFSDMFLAETGRGCEMGCRFCVSGYLYRPIRKRSAESLARQVRAGMGTGKGVGLIGASVSSHPGLESLVRLVGEAGQRTSLSSLMAQKVTPELASLLAAQGLKTVALAPEAGNEALRVRMGKRVADQVFMESVAMLAGAGVNQFKLYFMVGLPTEEEADVLSIVSLVAGITHALEGASRPKLTLSVNPFVPKAWTPFQWEGMAPVEEIERRLALLKRELKGVPRCALISESPRESAVQALLARGDRRVGQVLHEAVGRGANWKWIYANLKGRGESARWHPALSEYAFGRFAFERVLPWDHIGGGIDKELLRREAEKAYKGFTRACGCDLPRPDRA